MTEDQAKQTLCPMAATFGASQQLADGPGPHCVASLCMAWRRSVGSEPSVHEHMVAAGYPATQSEGYCGLAGAPA